MFNNKTLQTMLFVVCAVVLAAGSASAQSNRPYTFFVSGNFGGVIAPEAATDYYSYGFGFSFGVEYPVSPQWSLVGTYNYTFFNPDESMIIDWISEPGEYPGPNATNIEIKDGRLNAHTISLVGKGALRTEETKTYPYVKGGFGITVGGASEIDITWDEAGTTTRGQDWRMGLDTSANLSILLGVGVETKIGAQADKALFFEVGIHMTLLEIEGNSENVLVVPGTVGFRF